MVAAFIVFHASAGNTLSSHKAFSSETEYSATIISRSLPGGGGLFYRDQVARISWIADSGRIFVVIALCYAGKLSSNNYWSAVPPLQGLSWQAKCAAPPPPPPDRQAARG